MHDKKTPFEKREREGYLWHETESKVIRKGSVLMEKGEYPNSKDKNIYAAIVKTTVNGEDKYEFMVSAGLLYINSEADKRSDNSPDISGPVTIGGQQYKLGGWKKVSESQTEYTKIALDPKNKEPTTAF
tara:strand:- start:14302 stop:14688 length:387 start_codon:yes stop_codon:yes gene_type:complete